MPTKPKPTTRKTNSSKKSHRKSLLMRTKSWRGLGLVSMVVVFVLAGAFVILQSHAATATGPIVGIASKCLDNQNNLAANGNKIQLYTCLGNNNQKWTVQSTTGPIVNANGYCLDVQYGGTTPGTIVWLYQCNGTAAQQWTVNTSNHTIMNPQSGLCLDDQYGGTADGNQIWIYTCNGTAAQQWQTPSFATPTPTPTSTPTPTPVSSAGWTVALNDDFSKLTSLPAHWSPSKSTVALPQHPNEYFSPTHCTVGGGYLNMLLKFEPNGVPGNSKPTWYACAMAADHSLFTTPDVRITLKWRMQPQNNGMVHYVMPIHWPIGGCWPKDGEEDFFEGESPTYNLGGSFMHYSTTGSCSGGGLATIGHQYNVDLTQWHTFRFQRITSGTNVNVATYIDDMTTPVWTCNANTSPACNTTTMPATLKYVGLKQNTPFKACPDKDDPRYSKSTGCPISGGSSSYYDGSVNFQVASIIVENRAN